LSGRRFHLAAFACVIPFVLFGGLILNSKFDMVDDAYYIVLAKSLSIGGGYSDIHLPTPALHSHFPPGLPVVLSLPTGLGFDLDADVIIYKLILIVCGALGLYLFAHLAFSEGISKQETLSAVIISALSITFVGFTYRVSSEMLYFVLSTSTLVVLNRYEKTSVRSPWLIVLGFLMAGTILTRSIGIILPAASLTNWLFRREFKRAAALLSFTALLLLPWYLFGGAKTPGSGQYLKEFVSSFNSDTGGPAITAMRRIVENGWLLIWRDIPRTILSFTVSEFVDARAWLRLLLSPVRLLISTITCVAICRDLWVSRSTVSFYVFYSIVLIIFWPWDPSRYLVPLTPFICLSFICGFELALKPFESWKSTLAPRGSTLAVLTLVCALSHLVSDIRLVKTVRTTGAYTAQASELWNDTMAAYDWLKRNTRESSIIACDPTIEAHVFLYTGRKALPLPSNAEKLRQLGVTHVMKLDSMLTYKRKEREKRDVGDFPAAPVYRNASISIFQIGGDAANQR